MSPKIPHVVHCFGNEGIILYRKTLTELIFRNWHAAYWLHVYPSCLVFFCSKELRDSWKRIFTESNQCRGFSKKSNDKLILWRVNFDAMGFNRIRIESEGGETSHLDYSHDKMIYTMNAVRSKKSKQKNSLLHITKVESWSFSYGRTITCKLGSIDKKEMKLIRKSIRYCIEVSSKAGIKRKLCSDTYNPRQSNNTAINGDDDSLISGLSSTVYAETSSNRPCLMPNSFLKSPQYNGEII